MEIHKWINMRLIEFSEVFIGQAIDSFWCLFFRWQFHCYSYHQSSSFIWISSTYNHDKLSCLMYIGTRGSCSCSCSWQALQIKWLLYATWWKKRQRPESIECQLNFAYSSDKLSEPSHFFAVFCVKIRYFDLDVTIHTLNKLIKFLRSTASHALNQNVHFEVLTNPSQIVYLLFRLLVSIFRYIAVTQPIKYAKHKNSMRIFVTILLVWAISIAIGSPIVLGLNNTPNRVPDLCAFFNTNFIIFSSLVSFYIPCIIMVFLYWSIFKVGILHPN